jgi:hypothetical protein
MLYHDHGADPNDAHPALQAAIEQYWGQEVGSAWLSSPHENEFPTGMHAAFTNLSEIGTGCANVEFGSDESCVNSYFIQIHAAGTNSHGRTDVHSYKAALWVCNQSETQCGYVLTGGHHDYLWTHSPYKQYFCTESNGMPDPVLPPEYQLSQVPYTALSNERLALGENRILWNSFGPNAVTVDAVLAQRGYVPNRGLQIVWSEADAWDYAQGGSPACANPLQDVIRCPDGSTDATCSNNGTAFKVYGVQFDYEFPAQRPFNGYTDRWGNVVTGCTSEGVDCVPLIISASVPAGNPHLNRQVGVGTAPLQNFDDGTPLRRVPFTLDD